MLLKFEIDYTYAMDVKSDFNAFETSAKLREFRERFYNKISELHTVNLEIGRKNGSKITCEFSEKKILQMYQN